MKGEFSAFQYDNAGVLTEITGATDFSDKTNSTDVMYGVGVDGKINDTIKYRVDFERTKVDEGKEIISLVDYAKKYKISHSNLINKAKRQTIEAFLEKGKWKIGD
jgi:hypothetical protein